MNGMSRRSFCTKATAFGFSLCMPRFGVGVESAHVSTHLSVAGRVNLGSFYTPARYVSMVATWLKELGVGEGWTVADLSSGYGAFFELSEVSGLDRCNYIANDIDEKAVIKGSELFPHVRWMQKNALKNVSRELFSLPQDSPLVIVGNPPYNDVTSQINRKVKSAELEIDQDIKTRDLGMSSLLAYDKLKADYVAVLHPLSYLIKKANFSATKGFFSNYRLLKHVIFSSQEFAGTSKTAAFPVIVALYERHENEGLGYGDIVSLRFETVEGDRFSIDGFEYITEYIDKYPSRNRYSPEILFYTMRDINALKRSRTFLISRVPNAIDVDPEKLAYYCYIDCFKRYAQTPYWIGNFNVPFIKNSFDGISSFVVSDAKFHHPEVFGKVEPPTQEEVVCIHKYIEKALVSK